MDEDDVPPLRCPVPGCGGQITVRTQTVGQFGCTEDVPCGFECDRCWTEWDLQGAVSQVWWTELRKISAPETTTTQ